ncbi:MAG: hypothetical protein NC311_19470, partial [Muribaculaceae bacterium]|nr:hypothetical protein [Muribaculaceae bacterium]
MKKKILIPVLTVETRETRCIKEAENAITALKNLVMEIESGALEKSFIANKNIVERKPILFSICKTIDTDAIKEPLRN